MQIITRKKNSPLTYKKTKGLTKMVKVGALPASLPLIELAVSEKSPPW